MPEETKKGDVDTTQWDATKSVELLPPEGHDLVGTRLFGLVVEIIQDKEALGLPPKWIRNDELGKNKHWKRASSKVSLVSANLLKVHRQRTVNLLTDNNPTFNIHRVGGQDIENPEQVYDDLVHAAEYWWREEEQQSVLEHSVYNGETYGCCIEKMLFNAESEQGLGEVETARIDPFYFGWYPVKAESPAKAIANFYFRPISVLELRRKYPKFKDQITSDTELIKDLGDERREIQGGKPRATRGCMARIAGVIKNMMNVAGETGGPEDETLVAEMWVKDKTRILEDEEQPVLDEFQQPVLDENDEPLTETVKVQVPKYTGEIRYVVACNGGNLILEDRSNPSINPTLSQEKAQKTYLYDKFPFNFAQSNIDTSNAWGADDFSQLETLQLEIDKTISQITMVKDKASRLKLKNPKNSGVSNAELTNYPGIIRPADAIISEAIKYIDPPKLDSNLFKAVEIYKDFFFSVSGTFFLEAANTPGREVIAYKAIAALIEQAATLLRGKIRNYSKLIRDRGRMYISLMQNYYTEDRWITFEQEGEEQTTKIRGDQLVVPSKLAVVSGSTMPVSKIQQREEAIALFEKQALPVEDLLRMLEVSGWREIVKRLHAGPIGQFLEKLGVAGVPSEILEYFNQIAQMDPKEVEKAMEKGKVPSFPQLLRLLLSAQSTQPRDGEEGQPPSLLSSPQDEQKQLETQIKVAEANSKISKAEAEVDLISEKINSERVEQAVKLNGIELDGEMIKIKKAELVEKINEGIVSSARSDFDSVTKAAQSRGTAPYKERGLQSNNQ